MLETLLGVHAAVCISLQPILALLGHPVAGNPTQYMIEKAFAQHQLDWRYLTLEVAPEDLGDAVRGMKAMGFRGGNCIQPHKAAVAQFLDGVGRAAELSAVVNCIRADGRQLIGENTEGEALVDAIRLRCDPAGKRVVLFGGGNLARGAAVALALARVAEITLVDHSEDPARDLLARLTEELETNAGFAAWEQPYVLSPETEIVINATPIGSGDPDAEFPLDLESLRPEVLVADLIGDPPETWLIRHAAERGCATVDGLEILIAQSALDFKLWTTMAPDTTAMREAVEEFLEL